MPLRPSSSSVAAGDKDGQRRAVLAVVLLLERRGVAAGRAQFLERLLVARRPLRRRHRRPVDLSRVELFARVAEHLEEPVVGVGDGALRRPEHDSHQTGVVEAAEAALALRQRRLSLAQLGDVLHDAEDARRSAAGVAVDGQRLEDVAHAAVGAHDPEAESRRGPLGVVEDRLRVAQVLFGVLRMRHRDDGVERGLEVRADAVDAVDLLGPAHVAAGDVPLPVAHAAETLGPREPFHRLAGLRLALVQGVQREPTFRDVDDHAAVAHDVAVAVALRASSRQQPARRAVTGVHPPLEAEFAAGGHRRRQLCPGLPRGPRAGPTPATPRNWPRARRDRGRRASRARPTTRSRRSGGPTPTCPRLPRRASGGDAPRSRGQVARLPRARSRRRRRRRTHPRRGASPTRAATCRAGRSRRRTPRAPPSPRPRRRSRRAPD